MLSLLAILALTSAVQGKAVRENIYEYESFNLKAGESKSFESDYRFTKPDVSMNYVISTDKGVTLTAECNIKLRCQNNAYIYVLDKFQSQLLFSCSKGEGYEATEKVKSKQKMTIQMVSGNSYYSRYGCKVTAGQGPSPPSGTTPAPSKDCKCGDNFVEKIVNGQPAKNGEFPWQVSLQYLADTGYYNFFCGGSILSENYVLTAAHCLDEQQTMVTFFVGNVDLLQEGQRVGVGQIWQHEKYDRETTIFDLTIVKTDKPFVLNNFVYPICLPRNMMTETFAGKELLASGFGNIYDGGPSSNKLLKTKLRGMSNKDCKAKYGPDRINDGMLCATGPSTDTCQGDSGGPLAYKAPSGVYYLAGSVSWGIGCADPRYPGVYSRSTYFLDWIDSKSGNSICSR